MKHQTLVQILGFDNFSLWYSTSVVFVEGERYFVRLVREFAIINKADGSVL